MKREMRKLNRVKYVYSEEEVQRLVREGYVPVDPEQGTSGADGAGQKAAPTQGQDGADGAGQKAAPTQGQDGADGAGQTAAPTQGQDGADVAGQVADFGGQKTKRGTGKK